jgi:hypothetical protein
MTSDPVIGAFVRGRMHMAGIRHDTDARVALDVLTVIALEVPRQALQQLRTNVERASWDIAEPDRETWGLLPQHQAAMARQLDLMQTAVRG